jgi:putative spermidine/putrescine transport system substrate-binding protein
MIRAIWRRAGLGSVTALFLLALADLAPARAADLVVTAFGGVWEQAFRECYVAEFEKRTGKKVEVLLGGPVQWLNQIAANPDHPPIDVIVNSIDGAHDAVARKLVDPMTVENTPKLAEINPKFVAAGRGFGTILNYGAMGIAYNARAVSNPPKTWKEFVERTVRGDWKAAIPGINYPSAMVTVLWLYVETFGGDIDNIKPGLDQIKRMKDSGNLVFWNDVNGFLSMIHSGEIDIGMYWDGRTWAFHDDGNPDIQYINPQPGAVINPTLIQKVHNGSPLAGAFLDVALSAGPQACWGNKLQYGMSNTNVVFLPTVAPRITKMDEILWPPFEQVPARMSAWLEQWNRQIGP